MGTRPAGSKEPSRIQGRAQASEAGSQEVAGAERRLFGAPASATTSAENGPGDGVGTTLYVAAGFAVLAAALVGGFLIYRRRLP